MHLALEFTIKQAFFESSPQLIKFSNKVKKLIFSSHITDELFNEAVINNIFTEITKPVDLINLLDNISKRYPTEIITTIIKGYGGGVPLHHCDNLILSLDDWLTDHFDDSNSVRKRALLDVCNENKTGFTFFHQNIYATRQLSKYLEYLPDDYGISNELKKQINIDEYYLIFIKPDLCSYNQLELRIKNEGITYKDLLLKFRAEDFKTPKRTTH